MLGYHHVDCFLSIVQVEMVVLILLSNSLRPSCFVFDAISAIGYPFEGVVRGCTFAFAAAFTLRSIVRDLFSCKHLSLYVVDRQVGLVVLTFMRLCHCVKQ